MKPQLRRVLLSVLFITPLAAAAVASTQRATADILGTESVDRALEFTPDDPALREAAGLRLARESGSPEQTRASLRQMERAIALRPTSPYAWAGLAEARYRAGVADETFQAALANAARLGPNEPGVQETVAFYGLATWEEMRPDVRSHVEDMVAAGMRRDPRTMLTIAGRRGRLAIACGHFPPASGAPEESIQLCKSPEAK